MNREVAPGEDFFLYANGTWLERTEIPADRSATGSFITVVQTIEQRTRAILDGASTDVTTEEGKVGAVYRSFMDEAGIESRGLAPLKPQLDAIAAVKDRAALAALLGSLVRSDVDILNCTDTTTSRPLGLWVEQDLNEPTRNAAYLIQGGLGMPDRVYYLEGGRYEEHRKAYEKYLATLFTLAGDAEKDAQARAARVLAFEVKLAKTHASRADTGELSKGNNPVSRAELEKRAKGMDWKAFLTAAGLGAQGSFVLWQPSAVTGLAAMVASEPLTAWKDYLRARALDRAAPVLPKAFADASFAFYSTALRGVPQQAPRWKRGLAFVNVAVGQAMGQLYVQKHFPPQSRAEIAAMVENIRGAFDRRIDALQWMSADTKAKAKAKLKVLDVGVGGPERPPDFSGLTVDAQDPLGNLERALLLEHRRSVAKLGSAPDRKEWCMLPHEVNAVNLPLRNALHFPAAILLPPFFDPEATAAVNYGSIGAVIGHEISHSFDDTGAAFDDEGRVKNWWTPADLQHFTEAGQKLVAQYDAYKPFPDAAVNGKLTLSENIADLAGLAAAYDAWQAAVGGAAPIVDGFSGPQQFFIGYAQTWRAKAREPALRQQLVVDGHAPGRYRSLTVRNLDPWYQAFAVKEGQALYLAPDARVRVW